MSYFDIQLGDLFDDDTFDSVISSNNTNLTPRGNPIALATSRSRDPSPRRGLTTASMSDILQGTGILRHQGQLTSALNNQLSSDLSGLLASEGGPAAILGARSQMMANDILLGQTGFSDGRFQAAQGLPGSMTTGDPQANVSGVPAMPIGETTGIGAAPTEDGSPTILGPTAYSVEQIHSWWESMGKGQPQRLKAPIRDLISIYLAESQAEGIRGEWVFVQACGETGYFTNQDTSINNFAGIAHYDNAASGSDFADPTTGVRAHVQLLKKVAVGNDGPFANPDVAPSWGGKSATTWAGLTQNWASSPAYWTLLSRIYSSLENHLVGK